MKLLNARNVEFLSASADNIPLPDRSIDIVTANGIYNLSPDMEHPEVLFVMLYRTIFDK